MVSIHLALISPLFDCMCQYFNYAAAAVLCLIDCLTGECAILQSDLIYDAGISLNPAIDIGQIEGGFVMGLGYATTGSSQHKQTRRMIVQGRAGQAQCSQRQRRLQPRDAHVC